MCETVVCKPTSAKSIFSASVTKVGFLTQKTWFDYSRLSWDAPQVIVPKTEVTRERERERERQTDRQTDRQTGRQRERETGRQRERETDRQRERQTDRQTDRQTETDRQKERETERQRHRERDRERERLEFRGYSFSTQNCNRYRTDRLVCYVCKLPYDFYVMFANSPVPFMLCLQTLHESRAHPLPLAPNDGTSKR